jgi:hypothetical protein
MRWHGFMCFCHPGGQGVPSCGSDERKLYSVLESSSNEGQETTTSAAITVDTFMQVHCPPFSLCFFWMSIIVGS